MKTDRELLELAAKAAGIPIAFGGTDGDICRRTDSWDLWNPLTDDGDALRLAVKLGFWITLDTEVEMTVDVIKAAKDSESPRPKHHTGRFKYPQYGDAYAATRRAIVRAAAEIGAQRNRAWKTPGR